MTRKFRLTYQILGCALTIFHYLTYAKRFQEINPEATAMVCFFVSAKIHFYSINPASIIEVIKKIIAEKGEGPTIIRIQPKEFCKREVEVYGILGFAIQISTPFEYFETFLKTEMGKKYKKEILLRKFVMKFILESYQKPISIYYHPKIILYACLILGIDFVSKDYKPIIDSIPEEEINLVKSCIIDIWDAVGLKPSIHGLIEENFKENQPNEENSDKKSSNEGIINNETVVKDETSGQNINQDQSNEDGMLLEKNLEESCSDPNFLSDDD